MSENIYTQLKKGSKRPEVLEWNRKHGRSTSFRERNVFRLHLNESREGFCRRRKKRSFNVNGPKTEKALEPTVESLVRGIWRLRVPETERRVREGV